MAVTALTALAAATTVFSTVQSQRRANEAAGLQREANRVQSAQESVQSRAARRRAAREARVRRARLVNAASQTGTTQSSGFFGARSALGANFGSAVAAQTGGARSAFAISNLNQRASDQLTAAQNWSGIANLASSFIDRSDFTDGA